MLDSNRLALETVAHGLKVQEAVPYVTLIRPFTTSMVTEQSFFGSESPLELPEIKDRILAAFSEDIELIKEANRVFIYSNPKVASVPESRRMRYFLYTGYAELNYPFSPVDIVGDNFPNLTNRLVKASSLRDIFKGRYKVNFVPKIDDSPDLPPQHKFNTTELHLSR